MTRPVRLAALLLATALALAPAMPASASAPSRPAPTPSGAQAWYQGKLIDLSVSWQGAGACDASQTPAVCYSTEAEMDAALQASADTATMSADTLVAAAALTCSAALRLYDGTSYKGSALYLSTRGVGINLSLYGFDNRVSSYKVGACASVFYSGSNGAGSIYPGNTNSYALSEVMISGWDNVVSSVYIG